MSSCGLELEMVKSSPSPSHDTPSPSSTISETYSPPLTISTRRPRTSRKRPNQTYDEAEALLSTAYPNIFSSKKLKTQSTFAVKSPLTDYDEASQLLLPFDSIEENYSLLHPTSQTKSNHHLLELKDVDFVDWDDFDAGTILDEEIEEGIDSFMGNIQSNDGNSEAGIGRFGEMMMNPLFGSSTGFGSSGKFQLRSALRENDEEEDWWKFPTVEFEQISPRIQTAVADDIKSSVVDVSNNEKKKRKKKKKKKKKVAPVAVELKSSEDLHLNSKPEQRLSLLLKLDYDRILEAWSEKESPFSDEILGSDGAGIDLHTRLGEIDLFGESGMREASVLRYKEKRRNRLFSTTIRYQVRKLNADQRPRINGRFVRRANPRNLSGIRF